MIRKKSLTKEVLEGSFYNLTATIINRVGGLIFIIVLARFLMPEGFGIFSLATSIALMLFTFADLGINTTMLRYISYSLEKKKKKKAYAYFYYLFKIKIILTSVIAISLLLSAYPLSIFIFKKPELSFPLILSAIYLFFLSIQGFFEFLFYAFKKVNYLSIKEIILQSLRIFLIIFIFLLIAVKYYIIAALLVLIFSTLIVLFLIVVWIKKIEPSIFKKSKEKIDKKRALKFLGYISIGSISGAFFSYIDIIMLGIFVSAIYIGYYKAASSLVFGIVGFFVFFNILLPIFVGLKKENYEKVFNKTFKYLMMLVIPAAFGLATLGRYFVRAIYGYDYLSAYLPLFFLSFLLIENIGSGLFSTFFAAREKLRPAVILAVISVFLNIILNYFLISYFLRYSELYAITGAAVATLTSKYLFFIGMGIIIKKYFKIKINKLSIIKPVIASIFMVVILLIINAFIKDMTLVIGILEIFLGAFIYLIAMFLIKGITGKDFELIKQVKYNL